MSENGLITSELFVESGRKFVSCLPKDDPKPHLLLLDGHCTHMYNLEFLNTMRDNNVHQFCFPLHTTHCLQPADVLLFKSLQTSLDSTWSKTFEADRWPETRQKNKSLSSLKLRGEKLPPWPQHSLDFANLAFFP